MFQASFYHDAWSSGYTEGEAELDGSTFSCFTKRQQFKGTSVQRLTRSCWGSPALKTSLTNNSLKRKEKKWWTVQLGFVTSSGLFLFSWLLMSMHFIFSPSFPWKSCCVMWWWKTDERNTIYHQHLCASLVWHADFILSYQLYWS